MRDGEPCGKLGCECHRSALTRDNEPWPFTREDVQLLGAAAFAFRELSASRTDTHAQNVNARYEEYVLNLSRKVAAHIPQSCATVN